MSRGVFFTSTFLLCTSALAATLPGAPPPCQVQQVVSDFQIKIQCTDPKLAPFPGSRVVISGMEEGKSKVLGYALVDDQGLARIQVHSTSGLIRPGQEITPLDLTQYQPTFQGRTDLLFRDHKDISSRYRPMVYLGYLLGQTAANLVQDEHLVSLTHYAYGIHNKLQLGTTPLLYTTGAPNFEAKFNFFENEDASLSVATGVLYNFQSHTFSGNTSLYWDSYSNGRFTTYSRLTFDSQRFFNTPLTPQNYTSRINTEFQSVQSILLNNWDRVILGPKYNFTDKTIGGQFAYCWIADRFHFLVGLRFEDLLDLSFGKGHTAVSMDFWWRL